MTKRHFQLLADMLREIPESIRSLFTEERTIAVCKEANPRFDEEKFRRASGGEKKEVKNVD